MLRCNVLFDAPDEILLKFLHFFPGPRRRLCSFLWLEMLWGGLIVEERRISIV